MLYVSYISILKIDKKRSPMVNCYWRAEYPYNSKYYITDCLLITKGKRYLYNEEIQQMPLNQMIKLTMPNGTNDIRYIYHALVGSVYHLCRIHAKNIQPVYKLEEPVRQIQIVEYPSRYWRGLLKKVNAIKIVKDLGEGDSFRS